MQKRYKISKMRKYLSICANALSPCTYKYAYLLENAPVRLDRRWFVGRLHCASDSAHVAGENICRGICSGYVGPGRVPSSVYRAWSVDYGPSFDRDVCFGSDSEFDYPDPGEEVSSTQCN